MPVSIRPQAAAITQAEIEEVKGIAEIAGAMVLIVTATHRKVVETKHPAIVDYSEPTLEGLPDGSLYWPYFGCR